MKACHPAAGEVPPADDTEGNGDADNEEAKPFVNDDEEPSLNRYVPEDSRLTRLVGVAVAVVIFIVAAAVLQQHGRRDRTVRGHTTSPYVNGSVTEPPSTDDTPPSRAFPVWDGRFPCYVRTKHNKFREGMFYVKVPKTASLTLAGVGFRIAHRKGSQLLPRDDDDDDDEGEMICNVRTSHGDVVEEFHYARRDRLRSFLWTFVREPTSRTVSQYFYNQVSRNGKDPTDENFIKWARTGTKSSGTFQMDYIRLRVGGNHSHEENVRGILDDYDFVGITERLDESLVVLQIILDLDLGDILYLSAKAKQGTYVYVRGSGGSRCLYEQESFVSPGMSAYFASKEWQDHIAGDKLLYRAANRSLDRTIDRIGRETVASRLQTFRNMLKEATQECEDKAIFPCSDDGVYLSL